MIPDRQRIVSELRLPLDPTAGSLGAVDIAVALEDALGIVLPDDVIGVASLGHPDAIQATLDRIVPPA